MRGLLTAGECILCAVALAAALALGYGALGLLCHRAFTVAGLN
jgi:hypothetical protein